MSLLIYDTITRQSIHFFKADFFNANIMLIRIRTELLFAYFELNCWLLNSSQTEK